MDYQTNGWITVVNYPQRGETRYRDIMQGEIPQDLIIDGHYVNAETAMIASAEGARTAFIRYYHHDDTVTEYFIEDCKVKPNAFI